MGEQRPSQESRSDSDRSQPGRGDQQAPRPAEPRKDHPSRPGSPDESHTPWEIGDLGTRGSMTPGGGEGTGSSDLGTGAGGGGGPLSDGAGSVAEPGGTTEEQERLANPAGPAAGAGGHEPSDPDGRAH